MVEERKKEGRGETEFVWIKSHMSRNGALNKKTYRPRQESGRNSQRQGKEN